jgi:DNA replication protein DnaC
MLNQPTLNKLEALRLHGMAEAFRAQADPAQRDGLAPLSFEERFALLVDQEWMWRQNRALARRVTQAKFRYRASVEDIDFRTPRGLDRSLVRSLTQDSAWVKQHQNVFLLGPTGMGKSWLACALAEKACRDGFTAFFVHAPKLFRDLALSRADGSLGTRLARLARIDVLIVDDWVHAPLAESERRDFLEICEDRYQMRSVILTSQVPVAKWHEQIGELPAEPAPIAAARSAEEKLRAYWAMKGNPSADRQERLLTKLAEVEKAVLSSHES